MEDVQNKEKNGQPLLYRAAILGIFGKHIPFERGSITNALFVYLDGEPDSDSVTMLDKSYIARPWVCLTKEWEEYIHMRYPNAKVYKRWAMVPARSFKLPENLIIPDGYQISKMDGEAFALHPFSHGINYGSYSAFKREGSGAVARLDGNIVSSASSFVTIDNEVELDVSTDEAHRGKGLASACIAMMLKDCENRGITVHWDAQNERHCTLP